MVSNASTINKPHHCPVCGNTDTTTVVIDESIPPELQRFFTPITQQVDEFNSSCKFQFITLVEKINHLKHTNGKLKEKVAKQKDFLYAAKEEITHLNKYKSQVEDLKQELEGLKQKIKEYNRPETFELSNDDEIEYGRNKQKEEDSFIQPVPKHALEKPFNFASNTFISNIHKQSMGKKLDTFAPKAPTNHHHPNKRSFYAESTKIGELNTARQHRIPSAQLPPSPSQPPPPPPPPLLSSGTTSSISSSRANFQKLNLNKYRYPSGRAATSQLASRITANMRVGTSNQSSEYHNEGARAFRMANVHSNMISKGPVLNRILKKHSSGSSRHFAH
ncbi:hypothetical protein KGF57_001901 [Candida theae]|uniref:Uncharacterized protein n=1 Tax=Candida theae TaxID=1198502 RepID=A0AAD5BG11_9ASCO|nr:uncharacterized protein KGF57_001901 [Candida theae]KAI5960505.1 hypothetical protein KGF57_001901 [Candida theae]